MDIHKPKPVHSLREFLSEILVVVTGIAIALGGEQIIEALHWRHEVHVTEAAIASELGDDLRWALLVRQYAPCTKAYVDTLEAAIIAQDTPTVRKLYELRSVNDPIPAAPWSYGTYNAALSSQVADHLPEGLLAAYSREFTWAPMQVQYQFEMFNKLSGALTARLGLPRTPEVLDRQLALIETLRADENGRLAISEAMLTYGRDKLAMTPSNPAAIGSNAALAQDCQARLHAIAATAKP
ncbi:MAG: hypothetical protein KGL69_02805 [Alphaproteobacteria bacterium]|nr:hypothetical protein [Alphaproteobacteria bacterium]